MINHISKFFLLFILIILFLSFKNQTKIIESDLKYIKINYNNDYQNFINKEILLTKEINQLQSDNNIGEIISGSGLDSPGRVSTSFGVSREYSYVSVVSMIAPSPDWYLAVVNINLLENEEFVDEKSIIISF